MSNIDNGWVCFEMKVNKSDEKSDLIFSKPGYGYITLDYSKNVTGKCALQLRVNPKVDEIKEIRAELGATQRYGFGQIIGKTFASNTKNSSINFILPSNLHKGNT